jgi:acyl-coenzyme A thioesterase PaaI-like protein
VAEPVFTPVVLAPEHFIRWLDLGLEQVEGGSRLVTDIGDLRCDAGLIATAVDVLAGHLTMRERFPALLATTHIELHGIDLLEGPGELVADARTIASSKRRVITEVRLRLGGHVAIAHVGLAVREHPQADEDGWGRPRAGDVVTTPVWQQIGVEAVDGGARVEVNPHIHNHVGGLQGGAMVALLERAALLAAPAAPFVTDATINYLVQARAETVLARVGSHVGDVIAVDAVDAVAGTHFATAVFRIPTI